MTERDSVTWCVTERDVACDVCDSVMWCMTWCVTERDTVYV